MRDSFKY